MPTNRRWLDVAMCIALAVPAGCRVTAEHRSLPTGEGLDPAGRSIGLGSMSRHLDLTRQDRADVQLFNRILWRMMKGTARPYPAGL